MGTDPESIRRRLKLREVFLPGQPIDREDLFSGRARQVNAIYDAVLQPGRHVILFGERGVGKTSLALVLAEKLRQLGLRVISPGAVNCDGTDDFSSLWQKVCRELVSIVPEGQEQLADIMEHYANQALAPDDVRYVLSQFQWMQIVIFDELDRLGNESAKVLLADTLKNISDHGLSTTVVMVGVADTVEELIAEHRSIERNLIQVRMQRMTRSELEQIIDKGLSEVQMSIDNVAKNMIVGLSQGLPYYTHHFGLNCAVNAVNNGRLNIEMGDVMDSSTNIIHDAHNIRTAYHRATASTHESLYEEVLLACSLSKTDDMGYFTAADVAEPLAVITGKRSEISSYMRHLKAFCSPKRGPILMRIGDTRAYFYRFVDPLMQPFVVLDGIAKGKLTLSQVVEIQTRNAANTSDSSWTLIS